jgi:beta-phosphoglucomutase-like phosphatase (HAD superfamily)
VVDSSQITHGKPHPEIFLKAASILQSEPSACVAFEDSMAGLQSAKAAGMKVVAITTTHTAEELKAADLIIKDYTEIDVTQLRQLK